ncbi:MAG: metal-sensitive transcriptional regulator [Hyphomicrobiaceae bacterium]
MSKHHKDAVLKRLARIEGQVRGIARMVEDERYCIDVLTQLSAVRSALARVEDEVLADHAGHCIAHAIEAGDKADQRAKVEELIALIARRQR